MDVNLSHTWSGKQLPQLSGHSSIFSAHAFTKPEWHVFSRNNLSTRAGSLAIIRAMAESVDSDTLRATTCVFCRLSSFTMSSIAPTLFGRKTENCFTSGPPIFEVVSGKLTVIQITAPRRNILLARQTDYLILCVL